MTELTPYQQRPSEVALTDNAHRLVNWAQEADAAYTLAQKIVSTSFCPQQFRGKPAEAAAAMLAGAEVGLNPMASLRSFDVIQGTAAARALTLRAVAQAQGAQFQTLEETPSKVVMRARRRGSQEWEEVTWTIQRATQLGVTGKDNWKKQPQTMLVARATADLARRVAADAILGLGGYAAEELDDEQPATRTVTRETPPEGKHTVRRAQPAPEPVEPPLEPEPPAESAQDNDPGDVDPITPKQLTALHAALSAAMLGNRDDGLRFISETVGREVTTSKDLSKDEASTVLDALKEHTAPPVEEPTLDEAGWDQ